MKRWVVWHPKHNRTYVWANSPAGRRYAKRHGCNAADRDLCWSLDKIAMCTHEGVGVHEFKGRPRPRKMKWEKVRKLRRHGRWGRHIRSAFYTLRDGVNHGVMPFFDIKGGDERTQDPELYIPLILSAKRMGVQLHLMSQPFDGAGIASLAAARQAAIALGDAELVHLTLLPRGPIKDEWWDIIDDAKGWDGARPEGKPKRVGGRVA